MILVHSMLTIYFDDPFWVGVYQRITDGKLEVSRKVFGAEPKDSEVYQYFLSHFIELRFSPGVQTEAVRAKNKNPKRMQREIKRQLLGHGIGTKAQNALKLQKEQNRSEKKYVFQKKSKYEAEKQFLLKQQKKKEKHKGK